ncbi:glycosyltransferase involved in cell wall biosynthesis [Maribacter spongiicola]|uniref:Glycosyltransferase involved in cell wall biosynthesis n=1 Tax=Maribacter spongiicola TaxID=1206753 RepID=A0A4R7K2V5_9FLAO|nr:glycosyltransferase family 4 protein [Maribacter spongiicola]TDT44754.1 glycosyltransferase involved in cell wall biosynthesis [Maribacter spongiicola]
MKILWISNMIFPDLAKAIGQTVPIGGGWMYGLAKDIIESGVQLSVATVRPNINDYHGKINGITYHLLKGEKSILYFDKSLENKWKELITKVKPDLIHIHGTEYAHGLALVKSCPDIPYVISIQGMISVYAKYYAGQIPLINILKNLTLRDVLRMNSIWHAERKFEKRGRKIEVPYLKLCNNFIGRTQWDHDHVITINPKANYHFCNESLRDHFYKSEKWNLKNASKYTIFLSQALYPIKGLHKVLEALKIVKSTFPTVQLRIAGMEITKSDTFYDKLKMDGYGKYIKRKIKKYGLSDNVTFTGPLDEEAMAQEYLKCNLFICPSSIENSPNSLGEAQLLGVPCIASYVGGIPNMIIHGETGLLYRFEEVEMLAQSIKLIFKDDKLAHILSENSIITASKRHDRKVNCNRNINIYKNIIQNNNAQFNLKAF